jgi:CheY-like chemotaxis protein
MASAADPPRPFRVLLIEDTAERQAILKSLYRNQAWVLVSTGRRALTLLSAFEFDIVSLDYNLGDDLTGADLAKALQGRMSAGTRVVVHSMNPKGAKAIQAILPDAIVYPLSRMARSNVRMKKLRAGIDSLGPQYDFAD